MERFLKLCEKHKSIMDNKNILIMVYTNASGFLWSMCKVDSGTDLGDSGYNGNCEQSGTFKEYSDALEDAISLIEKCDLKKYKEETPKNIFHWGNYANYLHKNYRNKS